MEKSIAVSVFNQEGVFANTIVIVPGASVQEVMLALTPHRVTESANPNTSVISVRPMFGMEVNPEGFYTLIKHQLEANGLVEPEAKFQTGYNSYICDSDVTEEEGTVGVTVTVTNKATGTVVANINLCAAGVPDDLAETANLVSVNVMEAVAAVTATLPQAAEHVHEVLAEMIAKSGGVKEPAPTGTRPQRVTQDAPILERPNVNAPDILAQERSRVRNVVDEQVKKLKEGSQVAQQPAPALPDAMVLTYLDISPTDRPQVIRVAIEMTETDLNRFYDEGVVTTILTSFGDATIIHGQMQISAAKGYLVTLRQALADHNILPKSVTPRSIAAWSNDSVATAEAIDLLA